MADFRRPHHRAIARILKSLNATFLADAACYFGGGTHLAMSLGEYRESRDIDFLCSSRAGFRRVREEVTERSLGCIVSGALTLARDVRADRDGVRTFVTAGDVTIKFEIVLEGRIDLVGRRDPKFGVTVLQIEYAIAEKFLANTDRGLDDSTLSRDLIDLAFAAAAVDKSTLRGGLVIAEQAYGSSVKRLLAQSLHLFQNNRVRAQRCIDALSVDGTPTLRKGIRTLRTLAD